MTEQNLERLCDLIPRLRRTTEQAQQASAGILVAERNLSMILTHIEMLEIEVLDALQVLRDQG